MYIKKIKNFLPQHENISIEDFILILKKSNISSFDQFKLEKDFLLTIILIKFGEKYSDLIFKGWTCLNKIYFPYFRLSEDLDFVINTDWWRSKRKRILKEYENNFIEDLWVLWLSLIPERTKFDEYRIAMFTFKYQSILDKSIQTIKIDISLKWSLVLDSVRKNIQSIYQDVILEEIIFKNYSINCINVKEAIAEKIRASLTRKTPAIRDFFDIWYIKNNSDFNFDDPILKELVIKKLIEVDFAYTLDKKSHYDTLQKQIKTELEPVLKLNTDFHFDLAEIYDFILSFKIPALE